jgi:hypothetical protein
MKFTTKSSAELAAESDEMFGGHYRPVPGSDDEKCPIIVQLADDLNWANIATVEMNTWFDSERDQHGVHVGDVLRRFVDRIAEFEDSLVEWVQKGAS